MLLESIALERLLMLVQELRHQDAWQNVARTCGLDPSIHLGESSADGLLVALLNRQMRVEDLCECLQTLNLPRALSFISEPERLQILRQPFCELTDDCFWEDDILYVRVGGQLRLKIEAAGSPIPSYQWFHDNVCLSTCPELVIEAFSEHMEGLYYCIVQQLEDFGYEKRVISEDVTVKLSVKIHCEAPQIQCCEPTGKVELERGEDLIAYVEVSPGPEPTYSWRHKGKLIEGSTSNVLRISGVNEKCAGTYECRVKNKFGESSAEFELDVNEKRPQPSEKKALIITNNSYEKFGRLQTPHNDAESLKKSLSEYDFDCVHFQDLAAPDMKRTILKFFKDIKEGAYVLFYFGGHGLMENNSKYLMGCDADLGRLENEHVVHENVLEDVQSAKPLLFISILDMCQVPLNGANLKVTQSTQKWSCDAVLCYATSQNRLAWEPVDSMNSVYMKHLQSVLHDRRNYTFVDMILEVNSRVKKDRPEQVPQMNVLAEKYFKLSDPIQFADRHKVK